MSHSDSEEKARDILEFLAKTWKIIVTVIVVGLLAVWGWRYWQSHQTNKAHDASDKYELLISKLNINDPKSVEPLVLFAKETDGIYGILADLNAAKYYVDTLKNYAEAETLLVDATTKSESESLLPIINLRTAKLQFQLEKYEDSLKTLDKVTNKAWDAETNNLRGDILVKMQRYSDACNAYNVALASNPIPELENSINIKLNQAQYLRDKQAAENQAKTNRTDESQP